MRATDDSGQFIRKRFTWRLDKWDDGYVNAKGRFMVYYPQSERAYKNGYIMRSLAVYEIITGFPVPKGYDVHHKNENKLDDKFENLRLMKHDEHTKFHQEEKAKGKK